MLLFSAASMILAFALRHSHQHPHRSHCRRGQDDATTTRKISPLQCRRRRKRIDIFSISRYDPTWYGQLILHNDFDASSTHIDSPRFQNTDSNARHHSPACSHDAERSMRIVGAEIRRARGRCCGDTIVESIHAEVSVLLPTSEPSQVLFALWIIVLTWTYCRRLLGTLFATMSIVDSQFGGPNSSEPSLSAQIRVLC